MRLASVLLGLLALSCGHPSKPLHPAGDKLDDGNGQLALASMQLYTDDESDDAPAPPRPQNVDDAYGGTTYGGYTPPPWSYPSVNRNPVYTVKNDLVGAVEGTISWRGAVPIASTSCGAVAWLSVGAHHELAGALVFIHRVAVGRSLIPTQSEQRPAVVGGSVVKRGCGFYPVVQLVTPVPARVSINGDRSATRLRLSSTAFPMPALAGPPIKPNRYSDPYGPAVWEGNQWDQPADEPEKIPEPREEELLAGGRVVAQIRSAIMRIDSVDKTIGSAWVVGLATPAYAITDEAGRFRLDELAKGTYDVTIFVPPPPTVKNGALVYGDPIVVKRSVNVPEGAHAARLDVTVGK